MRVSEVMSRDVVTIEETRSCHEAVERMFRYRIRHLPVIDRAGALVGVVTDRDLRHRLFRPGVFSEVGRVPVEELLKSAPVAEIMSKPVVSVRAGDSLDTAAHTMLEDKVGSLPVVEDGRVVGILTETDLLRRIVREDACTRDIEYIVVSYP